MTSAKTEPTMPRKLTGDARPRTAVRQAPSQPPRKAPERKTTEAEKKPVILFTDYAAI